MNRINTAKGISTDHAIKPKKIYDRVSREQRGCSRRGADYNCPVVMVDEISKNETAVLAADLVGMFPPLVDDNRELDASPSPGLWLEQLDQQIERR